MWEEESGVQVALYEAKKLCGQAGVTPGLQAEQADVQCSHCYIQKAEAQISSSRCSAHRPYQPQGGRGSPLSVSKLSQLPARPLVGQCRPQRAAHRAGITAEAGISHLQQL